MFEQTRSAPSHHCLAVSLTSQAGSILTPQHFAPGCLAPPITINVPETGLHRSPSAARPLCCVCPGCRTTCWPPSRACPCGLLCCWAPAGAPGGSPMIPSRRSLGRRASPGRGAHRGASACTASARSPHRCRYTPHTHTHTHTHRLLQQS